MTPEAIFHYIYAVFHSPAYRARYAESLKIDFPRVPLTTDRAQFFALADKGAELVKLHLLEPAPAAPNPPVTMRYPVPGDHRVEGPRYVEASQRVYVNAELYFRGVTPALWAFQVGGYQVCDKWLKDRKGRTSRRAN